MARRLSLLVLLALVSAAPSRQSTLSGEIDKLVANCGLRDPKIGIAIYSVKQEKVLYRNDAGSNYLLASNTKLLTCSAALERLGADYEFETEIHVQDGNAALVVTGTGDPHISGRDFDDNPTAVFEKWAAALKAKGITKIEGPVKLVADKFEDKQVWPEWKRYPIDKWWAAPFGQFSLNDNCVDVVYAPGEKTGDLMKLTLRPDTKFVTVRNETRTVNGRGKVAFQFARKPGTNEIRFKGDYHVSNKPATTWVAIKDPQKYFGTVLKETLTRMGIEVTGGVEIVNKKPGGLRSIAKHTSKLARVIQVCLTVSQNYYAEMLFLHQGWKAHGHGSRDNAIKAIKPFLAKAGMKTVDQKDGSGLTRGNSASPDSLIALLKHMRKNKAFYDALAVNGAKKGTLRRRMTDKRYAGRVHAKTGHIAGVASLSGYVEAENGDTYIFSVLVNVDQGQSTKKGDRLQNQICELLVRWK